MHERSARSRLPMMALLPPYAEPWHWFVESRTALLWRPILPTLRRARQLGNGPAYVRDARKRIWYRVADLLAHWGSPASPSGNELIIHRLAELRRRAGGRAWWEGKENPPDWSKQPPEQIASLCPPHESPFPGTDEE